MTKKENYISWIIPICLCLLYISVLIVVSINSSKSNHVKEKNNKHRMVIAYTNHSLVRIDIQTANNNKDINL